MIEVLEIERQLKINKSDWTLVKLGDLAEDISKRVDNPAQSGYDRFVGLEHFVSGDLKIKSWGTTENLTSAAKAFQKGDILFARRNAYLRRASLVDFDGVCSGDAFVIRENHKKVVPRFLAFVMNSNELWNYANSNAAGTMSKRVKWRDLAEYKILLPPIDEQEQIAELLWAVDEMVQKNMDVLLTQKELFESSRNSIFSIDSAEFSLNILRDSIFTEKHFDKFLNDKTLNGIYKSKEYQGKGVRIINMGELFAYPVIRNEDMSLIDLTDKEKKQYLVREGDLLFARRSLVIEGAGKCAIIGEHSSPMTFESSMIRARLDTNKMNPKFVFHFLKSKEGRKRIRRIVGFTTVAGITSTDLAKVKIPFVSIESQNRIVTYLEQFEEVFRKNEELIKSSKKLQKSIINQIF